MTGGADVGGIGDVPGLGIDGPLLGGVGKPGGLDPIGGGTGGRAPGAEEP